MASPRERLLVDRTGYTSKEMVFRVLVLTLQSSFAEAEADYNLMPSDDSAIQCPMKSLISLAVSHPQKAWPDGVADKQACPGQAKSIAGNFERSQ